MSLRDVERAMIVFKYFYVRVRDFYQEAKHQVCMTEHYCNSA